MSVSLFIAISAVLEIFSVKMAIARDLEGTLFFHASAVLLILSLMGILFKRYGKETNFPFYVLASLVLFAGYVLSLVFFIAYASMLTKTVPKRELSRSEGIALIDLMEEEFPDIKREFGEGALLSRPKETGGGRIKILCRVQGQRGKMGMGVLKEFIQEKETGLYAMSIIEKREREIAREISKAIKGLEEAEKPEEKAALSLEAARGLWELIFMGLAEKDLIPSLLKRAKDYAELSLKLRPEYPQAFVLLGRIYLRLGDEDRAREFFLRAHEHGVFPTRTIPYVAEIYYKMGNLKEVKRLFNREDAFLLSSEPKISPIMELWKGNEGKNPS